MKKHLLMLPIIFLIAFSFNSSALTEYKTYRFLCRDGKTMAVVLFTPIYMTPVRNKTWYAYAWCDERTLKDFKNGIFADINRPAPLRACHSEQGAWIDTCYEKDFVPKCENKDQHVDVKKCFESSI